MGGLAVKRLYAASKDAPGGKVNQEAGWKN
jgi:hypothetical protein